MSEATTEQKQAFPRISPRAWEHPADRAALTALKKIPGLDTVLQKFLGATSEKSLHLIFLASAVRVSEQQFPQLHAQLQEACRIFDAPYTPALYVSQNPFFNAGAIGVEQPFIVLNSSLLDLLSEEETLAIIAHELGHCLSGHALYKTLLQVLLKLSVVALQIPLGGAALLGILAALMEWNRKSELSADRAGLLAVQDPTVTYTLLMKMAGGAQVGQMNIQEFFRQAAEYEGSGTVLDGVHKMLNMLFVSHPFPVIRLTELRAWAEGGDYARILAGEYPSREDDGKADIFTDFRAASQGYYDDIRQSKDALTEMVSNIIGSVDGLSNSTKGGIESLFGSAFGRSEQTSSHAKTPANDAAAPAAADAVPPEEAAKKGEQAHEVLAILEKLGELKAKGVITEQDFEEQKRKILQRL